MDEAPARLQAQVGEVLDAVDDFCRLRRAKVVIAVGNEFAKLFLVHEDAELPLVTALVLMVVTELRRQDLVEDHAAERCAHEAIAFDAAADLRLQLKVVLLISEQCLSDTRDDHALALGAWLEDRQVVGTENHILPSFGARMWLAASIRMRASACASADSGRWIAIWSPSKSAL